MVISFHFIPPEGSGDKITTNYLLAGYIQVLLLDSHCQVGIPTANFGFVEELFLPFVPLTAVLVGLVKPLEVSLSSSQGRSVLPRYC